MIGAEASEKFRQFLFDLLNPPRQESVVQWVEENVTVPVGPHQGKLSMSMIPYGREILERFGSRLTRHLVLCFGSQAAKTTLLILGMLYRISRDPKDTLWVSGNKDMATGFNKERFIPFAENCAPVAMLIPKTQSGVVDRRRFGYSSQHYVNMVLNFVGSNSPTNLSSRPVGNLIMDETDKYAQQSKFEAGALDLAEERNKAYPFPFVAKASTPTLESGIIWPQFLLTDQRYYNLPCPRCERKIVLKFTAKTEEHGDCGLRWWREHPEESKTDGQWDMKKVSDNAFYRCQGCGGEIQNHERPVMLENGLWVPTNPRAEAGRFGYHLSSLYAILSEETNFSAVAVKWLLCNTMSAKQNFINSWLAELWDLSRGIEQQDVKTEAYEISSTPSDCINIGFGDVQLDHYWFVARRFQKPSPEFPNGQSWLLYADRVETEEELIALQKQYQIEGENFMLDMAHNPLAVGRMIVKNGWRGALGTDTKTFQHRQPDGTSIQRMYSVVNYRDAHYGTSWQSRTFEKVMYFKYFKDGGLDLVSALRFSKNPIWHVSPNVSDRYSRQLNSKVKLFRLNPKTNRPEFYYKDLYSEDHMLDCEVGCAVRAVQLGLVSVPDEVAIPS